MDQPWNARGGTDAGAHLRMRQLPRILDGSRVERVGLGSSPPLVTRSLGIDHTLEHDLPDSKRAVIVA